MRILKILLMCSTLFMGLAAQAASPKKLLAAESRPADQFICVVPLQIQGKQLKILAPDGYILSSAEALKLLRIAQARPATPSELRAYTSIRGPGMETSCLVTLQGKWADSYCPDNGLWYHKMYPADAGFTVHDLFLGASLARNR